MNGRPDGYGTFEANDWKMLTMWKNGFPEGKVISCSENNWSYFYEVERGKLNGRRIFVDESNGIRSYYEYKDGKRDGRFIRYIGGTLVEMREYKDDKRDGVYRKLDANGKLIEEGVNKNGKKIKYINY